MSKIPPQVNTALAALEAAGFEAYMAGGCVRDALMGKEPQDYDITTSALPSQVKEVFCDCKVIETGIAQGTVTVLVGGMPLEITTYRIEGNYSDSRHPDEVTFTPSLQEDLARRDFTVNAMALSRTGQVMDCFGGRQDIEAGIIRCVGDPKKRFGEDALRIMRALRFAATLGFEIEHASALAAHAEKERLQNISAERIREELVKLLCGKTPRKVLTEFSDILAVIIPEIEAMKDFDQKNPHHIYDVLEHTAAAIEAVPAEKDLRLAALFHDIGKPQCFSEDEQGVGHFFGHAKLSRAMTAEIMGRLKFDNQTKAIVTTLVEFHDRQIEPTEKAVKRALSKLSPEIFFKLIQLKRADNAGQNPEYAYRQEGYDRLEAMAQSIIEQGECFSLKNLAINGNDLASLGLAPGKETGRILQELLSEVIEGRISNEESELKAAARAKIKKLD